MKDKHSARPVHFLVPGEPGDVAGITREGGPAAATLPGVVKTSVRVGAQRAGSAPVRASAVPGEDIVALHIDGGPVLLLHPESARELLQGGDRRATRSGGGSGAGDALTVPTTLPWTAVAPLDDAGADDAAARGLGDLAGRAGRVLLKGFQVLSGLAQDSAADFAASLVVKKLDGQVEAGVYPLQASGTLTPLKGRVQRLVQVPASPEPLLVFVHGTFVDTASTFAKLWQHHSSRVRDLFAAYGERVYALDHPTLGASPVDNAMTLVEALPQGARLHLVTHSRGGLVAEVLARVCAGPLDPAGAAAFGDAAWQPVWVRLQALAQAVAAKGIRVERVVRVACPARGTLLAGKRLDVYLSVLRWLLERAQVPIAPELLGFLGEVARRRADPAQIPGLAAMMPNTPLVAWLNAAPAPLPGDMRVIAGDLELGGWNPLNWAKSLLTDAYYWTAHDIVVNTASMYGGAPRQGGASYLLDQGSAVTHFDYFVNDKTADAVTLALTSAALPPGFEPIGPLSWEGRDSSGQRGAAAAGASRGVFSRFPDRRADPSKPAVFLLPGILGSNLRQGADRIWLGWHLLGGFSRLAYQAGGKDGVREDGPLAPVYAELAQHLSPTHEVIPFGYDWRLPIEDEAQRLATALQQVLEARKTSGQPVRILAHSMGGLVARAVQLVAPALWDELMAREGARFVMLGTPNGGSWAPMQVLAGDDSFGNLLTGVGALFSDHRAREQMADYPGFLQLQAGLLDPAQALDRSATWQRLAEADFEAEQQRAWWQRHAGEAGAPVYRWGVPEDDVLAGAVALRRRLDEQVTQSLPRWADRTLLVVGQAPATPVGFEESDQGVLLVDSDQGDGRVALTSALLPGVKTWKLGAEHGRLPMVESAFAAYADLLERGATARLPQLGAEDLRDAQAPASRGTALAKPAGHLTRRPIRRDPGARPGGTPGDFGSVEPAAPKARSARLARRAASLPPLQIQVLNGHLGFIHPPLMLGHYRSSELTGTEAVVDRLLGGALQEALKAGLYPDAPGSFASFINTQFCDAHPWQLPCPRAAIVVGLGAEGALKTGQLQSTVCQGVKAWARRTRERQQEGRDDSRPDDAQGLELAATLIGSGGLGVTPGASARAIAAGVAQANRQLAQVGWPTVRRLVLVEWYLDRASDAWRGLQLLEEAEPQSFAVEETIASGTGPLRRQLESSYRGADYDLISVTTPAEGSLAFTLDTRRARSEVRAERTQAALVRKLIARAASGGTPDATLGRTLFNLLVPLELRPFLAGSDATVLKLDDGTAAIPWELLDVDASEVLTREAGGRPPAPWAIRTRLIRTLGTEVFRRNPVDASLADAALVVGEPATPEDAGFPALPGALAEAQAVERLLSGPQGLGPGQVQALLDSPPFERVIGHLLDRPWRIIHVAGHGVAASYRDLPGGGRELVSRGGVVLSEGVFLGPDEIAKLPVVPELVFINCCHLGGHESAQVLRLAEPAAFAAAVADELIRIGVRCVVAAGWAVDDEPAQVFATTFYRALLDGANFIDAVGRAREATWESAPHSKTWAAYQCYGDPNWRLRKAGGQAPAASNVPTADREVASPVGLALVLEDLAVRLQFAAGDEAVLRQQRRQARARLDTLEQRFEALWGSMGAVAEAFAVAWQALREDDAAIRWYGRAVQANDASASLRAQEQLGHLLVRRAWNRGRAASAGPAEREQALVELTEAMRSLQALNGLQPTPERGSLVGSGWKRRGRLLALLGRMDEARACWQESLKHYRLAEQAAAAGAHQDQLHYPGLNRMALQRVLGEASDPEADRRVRESLRSARRQRPDFFNAVDNIVLDLLDALADDQLAREAPALGRHLADLHARSAAPAPWESVLDQLRFLVNEAGQLDEPGAKAAAQLLLEQVSAYAQA